MPRDAYSTSEAAKVLGLSERRVRQLISEGKLPADRDKEGNLRVAQAAVHAERRQRRAGGRRTGRKAVAKRAASAGTVDADSLAETVAARVSQVLEGQLEITQRAESLARQELDQERARRREVEEQLAQARADLAAAREQLSDAGRKFRLFRRKEA